LQQGSQILFVPLGGGAMKNLIVKCVSASCRGSCDGAIVIDCATLARFRPGDATRYNTTNSAAVFFIFTRQLGRRTIEIAATIPFEFWEITFLLLLQASDYLHISCWLSYLT